METVNTIKCHEIINDKRLEKGDVVAIGTDYWVGPKAIGIGRNGHPFTVGTDLGVDDLPEPVLMYYICGKDNDARRNNAYRVICLNYFASPKISLDEISTPEIRKAIQHLETWKYPQTQIIDQSSYSICDVKQWHLPEPYGRSIQNELERLETK